MATQGMLLVLSMAVSILVTRSLGVEGRGALAWIMAFTQMGFTLIVWGAPPTTRKYVAKFPQQTEIFLSVSVGIIGASYLISLPVLYWYGSHSLLAQQHHKLLILAIFYIPWAMLGAVLTDALIGLNRGLHANLLNIIDRMMYFALAFVLIFSDHVSPRNLFLATMLATSLRVCVTLRFIRPHIHRLPALKELKSAFKNMRKMLLSMHINGLAMSVTSSLLTLVLSYGSTSHKELGYYATARILPDAVFMFSSAIALHTVPRLLKENTQAGQQRTQRYILTLTLTGLLCIGAVLFCFAETIIGLLFGEAFLPAAPCLRALVPGIIALGVMSICQEILASQQREFLTMCCPVASAVVAGICMLLFKHGLDALTASYIFSITYMIGCGLALSLVTSLQKSATATAQS